MSSPENLTTILERMGRDGGDSSDLLPIVYEELRKLAHSRLRRECQGTLNTTALVHEAYIRLGGDPDLRWDDRRHFFGAAANAMRQILVDRAREKRALKRSHKVVSVEPDYIGVPDGDRVDILALQEALARLEENDPRAGQVVTLRCFAGLTVAETAQVLEVSEPTVKRDWSFATAWLFRELKG